MKYLLIVSSLLVTVTALAIPMTINYQGNVEVNGTPFDDLGGFKFAIVNEGGTETFWSNDGTSISGSEPTLAIAISVNQGLYNVNLGGAGMDPISGSIFESNTLYLRVWFDDGTNGSQLLIPDQLFTAVSFAFKAADADTLDGVDAADLEESSEIDSDIMAHAGIADAHHTKTTSFTELTDKATDTQIPDAISINNGRLYAPSGAGNVGIGKTSPGEKLDVNGKIKASNGFTVDSAGNDGVYVGTAGAPSTSVSSAGLNGFEVEGAERFGLYVGRADIDGVRVYAAGDDGVHVDTAGSPSQSNTSDGHNGFEVEGVERHGLYVGYADVDGVNINTSSDDGFQVSSAGDDGLYVGFAGDNGVHIYSAGSPSEWISSDYANGIEIEGAEGQGVQIGHADGYGVRIDSSGNTGFYVNHARNGFRVRQAGSPSTMYTVVPTGFGISVENCENDGIQVTNAEGDGVDVVHAADIGVDANTTQENHEWGVHTLDKIYAGTSLSTKSISTHVKNTGPDSLKPGDLVSLAKGRDENVLAEDSGSVPHVSKTNQQNTTGVIGVVEYAVDVWEKSNGVINGKELMKKTFRYSNDTANPGDYLSIIVFGPADVRCGENKDVSIGDPVTVDENGSIRPIQTRNLDGVTVAENVGIVGKAMEDSNGSGLIRVFVNCL